MFELTNNIILIFIGLFLAILDLVNNYILKNISLNIFSRNKGLVISSLLYLIQPFILLKGLNYGTLTVLNLSWDILSDILVTALGLFYFREQVSGLKIYGVGFALLALCFFILDDYYN